MSVKTTGQDRRVGLIGAGYIADWHADALRATPGVRITAVCDPSPTAAGARLVVEDYFAKSGMSEFLDAEQEGDIDVTLNSSKVSASARMTLDTYLMKLSGVDTLTTAAGSTAEVTIPKLEIVLVLDVSGSMAGTRLAKLKPAAKEFVASIMDNTEPGDAVISIVPFSWGVTPSKSMFEALAVNKTHGYSTCIKLKDDDFKTTVINPSVAYDQQIYTSKKGNTFGNLETTALGSFGDTYYRSCYRDEYFQILPYSTSKSALNAKIDSLEAAGSTSADEGMKWAAALLDPAFTSVVTALQVQKTKTDASGTTVTYSDVDASLTNMPSPYGTTDTLKVVVLMGDGANDTSYFFSSNAYRGPNSDLHWVKTNETERVFDYLYIIDSPSTHYTNPSNEQYCGYSAYDCVYIEPGEKTTYYLRRPSDDRMINVTDGGSVSKTTFDNFKTDLEGYLEEDQLDWEEAWGLMSPDFYKDKTGNWGPKNNYASNAVEKSDKDARMVDICTATKKDNRVTVFTIAFEMGDKGTDAGKISDCSTDPVVGSHHYNATKVNIKSAFSAIAANVKHLRLTQ